MSVKIYIGDCQDVMAGMEAGSVHSVITSPPYFNLRSYLDADDPDKANEIGTEKTPQEYVAHLVEVARGIRRVLRGDGLFFCNLGDSYASNPTSGGTQSAKLTGGEHKRTPQKTSYQRPDGLKPKDLIGIPWRVALALQADGWWLRSAIPWVKRNPMPESVTDRVTTAHEYIFMFSKSKKYWYDAGAVRVAGNPEGSHSQGHNSKHYQKDSPYHAQTRGVLETPSTGRNRRTSDTFYESLDIRIAEQRQYLAHLEQVKANGGMLLGETGEPVALLVNTASYKGAHFATFPLKLVKPLIACSTSEKGVCPSCGAQWIRKKADGSVHVTHVDGWDPSCACFDSTGHWPDPVPCVVFDPFGGSGTTALEADRQGRDAIIVELNATYARDLAYTRIAGDAPMFADVEVIE